MCATFKGLLLLPLHTLTVLINDLLQINCKSYAKSNWAALFAPIWITSRLCNPMPSSKSTLICKCIVGENLPTRISHSVVTFQKFTRALRCLSPIEFAILEDRFAGVTSARSHPHPDTRKRNARPGTAAKRRIQTLGTQ